MKAEELLEEEEWEQLMQLIFLGEYAVNGCRLPDEVSFAHKAVAEKCIGISIRCVQAWMMRKKMR